jgi:hypothetical protein
MDRWTDGQIDRERVCVFVRGIAVWFGYKKVKKILANSYEKVAKNYC